MFNLNKISAYSNEDAYLRNYLRSGINVYDFESYVFNFLKQDDEERQSYIDYIKQELQEYQNISIDENDLDLFQSPELEQYKNIKKDLLNKLHILENIYDERPDSVWEFGQEWLEFANSNRQKTFSEWIKNSGILDDMDSYHRPAYTAMDYSKFIPNTWLVHFTDDADSIASQGFEYGHSDYSEGLHLSTWKSNRKFEKGYNFAFEAFSSDADDVAASKKYGKEAVVFWGSGVKVYHYGDEEKQIIFWGDKVDPQLIFPMYSNYDEWYTSFAGRDYLKSTDEKSYTFDDVVNWIINNHSMINNIRNKKFNLKKIKK